MLIWIVARGTSTWRWLAVLPLLAFFPTGVRGFVVHHDPLPKTWEEQALECAAAPGPHAIMVHTGSLDHIWTGTLSGPACKRALESSLLR
jgi:hypothetical protein